MKFIPEQLALCPPDPAAAIELLIAMGMQDWVRDIVVARGTVGKGLPYNREPLVENVAHLAFNYPVGAMKELEILHYSAGPNWMANEAPSASHLGMHCTEPEAENWRKFFDRRGIKVVQEVNTLTHSNPEIAGKRWYHYIIFHARPILGIDIKLIVRKAAP